MKKEKSSDLQRIMFLYLIAILIVVGYIARLFYLQILSPEYKAKAERNAFYYRAVYPERGVMFDRAGRLLVYNEPAYDILVVNKEVRELDTLEFCRFLGVDIDLVRSRFEIIKNRNLNPGYSPYTPQTLLTQINVQNAGRFQEHLYKFPGFLVQHRSVRKYDTSVAAHVLGYMSECNQNEIAKDSTLALGDYIGKSGVERFYDQQLRGEKGYRIMLRDARGRIKGRYNNGMSDIQEKRGSNITLSLDIELQKLGESLMRGKRGAIVMIEPQTGEVLCLVTSPNFEPSLLSGRDFGKNHIILEREEGKPLFNRAIQGAYPPGSTFKTAQAAIFLNEGVISSSTQFTCYHGYPRLRGKPACHPHSSPLSVEYALTTSCNAFFCWGLHYMLDDRSRYPSVQAAFTKWKDYMISFGCGYPVGIDLPGEKRGFIPNSDYYDKWYQKRWSSSSIISNSIGQGEVLMTPLQLANMAAIIANRGYYYLPHVVRDIAGKELDTTYTQKHITDVKEEYWELIVRGMAGAVTAGTCRAANFAPGEIEVCGKTGTAENRHGKDHSAFIGFAPRNNPQVAIAVYVENGGFGATFGVPIGRVMMEYYLREGNLSATSAAIVEQMKYRSLVYTNDR